MNNNDAFNSMTIKEKAQFLAKLKYAPNCKGKCHQEFDIYGKQKTFCEDCWEEWLNTEDKNEYYN